MDVRGWHDHVPSDTLSKIHNGNSSRRSGRGLCYQMNCRVCHQGCLAPSGGSIVACVRSVGRGHLGRCTAEPVAGTGRTNAGLWPARARLQLPTGNGGSTTPIASRYLSGTPRSSGVRVRPCHHHHHCVHCGKVRFCGEKAPAKMQHAR